MPFPSSGEERNDGPVASASTKSWACELMVLVQRRRRRTSGSSGRARLRSWERRLFMRSQCATGWCEWERQRGETLNLHGTRTTQPVEISNHGWTRAGTDEKTPALLNRCITTWLGASPPQEDELPMEHPCPSVFMRGCSLHYPGEGPGLDDFDAGRLDEMCSV